MDYILQKLSQIDWHINGIVPIALLIAIAIWENAYPCRQRVQPQLYRWGNMIAIRIAGKIAFRVLLPVTMAGFAEYCALNGYGLFNHVAIPTWALIIATVLLLDLSGYLVHAAAHQNQFLWRAHQTHHLDTEYDVTTALRTHPFDDLLSMIGEAIFIFTLGLSAEGVLYYAVISGIIVKFSHANVEIWDRLDRVLRWFIVTPNMHRIHHSAERKENDSNYSTHFSWWDRLFGTYTAYPSLPHAEMKIGLHQFRHPAEIRVDRLLLRPFHSKEYAAPSK